METLLGSLVFAALLLAYITAVVAVHAEGRSHGPHAGDGQATLARGIWGKGTALGVLFLSSSACAQDLSAVAHRFLQRHGVPCQVVLKVGSPQDLGEVATCGDRREWALFWLEDEIAFIHPQTREAYKWDREIYLSYPGLYSRSELNDEYQVLASDGR